MAKTTQLHNEKVSQRIPRELDHELKTLSSISGWKRSHIVRYLLRAGIPQFKEEVLKLKSPQRIA